MANLLAMTSIVGMDAPLIGLRLAELRKDAKLSRSRLSWLTVREGSEGVPEATIRRIETHPGVVPGVAIIESLARALGVPPESFYEYPIAKARAAEASAACQEIEAVTLDEQEQDLEALAARASANGAAGAAGRRGARRAAPRR